MDVYDNWREEKQSAYLYGIMVANETNILHKKLFTELKNAAEKQAGMWENKIKKDNLPPPPPYHPGLRTRFIARLIKYFGAENLRIILSAMKIRGMSLFTRYHTEHKHIGVNSASNLRAAVFGINDGLISNMSLILGVAGANANQSFIVLAGVAGLLAGACSMGAGEYVSVLSQRELFEYQIAIERQELEEYPEEEMEELSYIYQARGVPKPAADKLARIMIENPETGLNTLAREELGLNPDELVSPVGAMIASFFSFALGAFVPLVPFLFGNYAWNLTVSMIITAITLFLVGVIMSLFTNRHPVLAGLRMLVIGSLAGALTYSIGWLLHIER